MDNLDIKQEAQMMFDILLDKKADYIDFLLEKAENCTGEKCIKIQYVISKAEAIPLFLILYNMNPFINHF